MTSPSPFRIRLEFVAARLKQVYYIGAVLDEATMTEFRAAVQERIADSSGARDLLPRALVAVVAEARHCGMTAEQLVICIKGEWNAMLEAGLVPHGVEPARVRDSVVSSAIRAYYVQ